MKPNILSVSRREDIPAFRSKWFMTNLKKGYVDISNSYKNYRVEFDKCKFIVFWTKNPQPMIKHLDDIKQDYYFQFSLNDYPEYELNLPSLDERIKTFIELSEKIGKGRVIWRFDPIIIDNKISQKEILKRIENIGNKIYRHTEKLVFSFVDPYKKLGCEFKEINDFDKEYITKGIIDLNENWGLDLATCAENVEEVEHNKCIDPVLIERICGEQKWISKVKDKNQRELCGCVISTDIGSFKTCKFKCTYCYAK